MTSHQMLTDLLPPGLAFLLLAAALLPIPRWQALLLWLLGTTLRLAGLIAVGLGAAFYFQWLTMPADVAQVLDERLGGSEPPRLLALTSLAVIALVALTGVLDFARRLLATSFRIEGMLDQQQVTASLLHELLERAEGPGATMTIQRRRELESALSEASHPTNSTRPLAAQLRQPPAPRRTLGQLLQ